MLEPVGSPHRRARTERRTEALVGALVEVESGQEFDIEALWRRGDSAAVVGQRRIERQPSRRDFDNEAIEPFARNEVEQRRRGDEIERAIEGELEVAREIDESGRDGHVRRMSGRKSPRQKTETIVHQAPALTRWKMGSHRPQRRAGATGEIDDRDRDLPKERDLGRRSRLWRRRNAAGAGTPS